MTKVTTKSGFECEVNDEALDNIEFLEVLGAVSEGEVLAVPKMAKMLLSTADKKRLYDHIRTEDGRVPTAQFSDELMDIFMALGDAKK